MVYQTDSRHCGKAAVREVLSLLYRDTAFETMEVEEDCFDFLQMKQALASQDVTYAGVEVYDLHELEKKDFPLIVQVKREERLHFVVVTKVTKKKASLHDPQFGEYSLSLEEFKAEFTGKAMLFVSKGTKPEITKIRLLTKREYAGYFSLILCACLSMFLFFYGMKFSLSFPFQIASLTACCVLGILQFGYNFLVQRSLEKRVLFPYLAKVKHKEDYPLLQSVLTETIRRISDALSYFLAAFGFTLILLWNDYYLSLLILVAVLFSCLRFTSREEKHAAARYCSLKEEAFLRDMQGKQDDYFQAKKRAEKLALSLAGGYLIEAMLLSVLILTRMMLRKLFSLDEFLFAIGISLSLSWIVDKLFDTLFDESKKNLAINRLSLSFSSFFLQERRTLAYNKVLKKGVMRDGEKKTHS